MAACTGAHLSGIDGAMGEAAGESHSVIRVAVGLRGVGVSEQSHKHQHKTQLQPLKLALCIIICRCGPNGSGSAWGRAEQQLRAC